MRGGGINQGRALPVVHAVDVAPALDQEAHRLSLICAKCFGG